MMQLFKRNKLPQEESEAAHDSRVEVVVHKNATKEAIEIAKQANNKLNKLLEEDDLTIKIYLAAGGRHPHAKTGRA